MNGKYKPVRFPVQAFLFLKTRNEVYCHGINYRKSHGDFSFSFLTAF